MPSTGASSGPANRELMVIVVATISSVVVITLFWIVNQAKNMYSWFGRQTLRDGLRSPLRFQLIVCRIFASIYQIPLKRPIELYFHPTLSWALPALCFSVNISDYKYLDIVQNLLSLNAWKLLCVDRQLPLNPLTANILAISSIRSSLLSKRTVDTVECCHWFSQYRIDNLLQRWLEVGEKMASHLAIWPIL